MGCILDKTAYEWEIMVNSFDVDRYNRLKLSSLLKFHQEIGERHLNEFGTSSDYMINDLNLAFIFTKIKVAVTRLPSQAEKVKLTTWCSELKGIRFYRNYRLQAENGDILTETKAEVIVIDLKDRKPVRPNSITGFEDFLYNTELENSCEKPQKLSVPDKICKTIIRPIRFSDIDRNGHVNNTIYADISLDCLEDEALKQSIKSFEINFINEVLPNENLELSVFKENNEFFILGKTSENHSFTSKITF